MSDFWDQLYGTEAPSPVLGPPELEKPSTGPTQEQMQQRALEVAGTRDPEISDRYYNRFLDNVEADDKEKTSFLAWEAGVNAQGKYDAGGVREVAHLRTVLPALRNLTFDQVYEKRETYRTASLVAGIDFEDVRRRHPVMEKYIRDPEKAGMALEASATLEGHELLFGRASLTEFTDPKTGTKAWVQDESKYIPPPWAGAPRDAATKGVPLLMAQAAHWLERLNTAANPNHKFDPLFQNMSESIKRDMARDYWGTFSGDRDSASYWAKNALTTGLDFVTSQWPILALSWGAGGLATAAKFGLGTEGIAAATKGLTAIQTSTMLAKAATPGVTAVNAIWFAPGIFERVDEATKGEHPLLATFLALPTAAVVGRLMAAGPVGTLAGSGSATRVSRFVEEGLTRHLFGALEKESAVGLFGNAAARFGYHFFLGKTTFALQQASEQIAVESGRALGLGETPSLSRISAAAHEGWKAGDAAWLMSGFGVARTMYRETGRMVQARRTGQVLDHLMEVMKDAKTGNEFVDSALKEIGSKGRPVVYVPTEQFFMAAEHAGVKDPRKFWQETLGLSTPHYDAVIESKGAVLQIPLETIRLLKDSKHFSDLIKNFGKLDPSDYSVAEVAQIAAKMLPYLEDTIKAGKNSFGLEEMAIYADKYEATLKSLGVSEKVTTQAEREQIADNEARLVLGYVKGFQRLRAPHATLDQVYQETFGKEGIFGVREFADGTAFALFEKEPWAPAFYSGLEQSITAATRKSGNVQAWLNDMQKGGAKPEEMHDIGLEGFLEQFQAKPKATAEEVRQFIRNMIMFDYHDRLIAAVDTSGLKEGGQKEWEGVLRGAVKNLVTGMNAADADRISVFLSQFKAKDLTKEQLLEYVRDAQLKVEVKLNQDPATDNSPERAALAAKYDAIEAKYQEYDGLVRQKMDKAVVEIRERAETRSQDVHDRMTGEKDAAGEKLYAEQDITLEEFRAFSARRMEELRAEMGTDPRETGGAPNEVVSYDIRVERFLKERRDHEHNMKQRRIESERRLSVELYKAYAKIKIPFDEELKLIWQSRNKDLDALRTYRQDLRDKIQQKKLAAVRGWLEESAALGDTQGAKDAVEWRYQIRSRDAQNTIDRLDGEQAYVYAQLNTEAARRTAPYLQAFDAVERRANEINNRMANLGSARSWPGDSRSKYDGLLNEYVRLKDKQDLLQKRIETINDEYRNKRYDIDSKYDDLKTDAQVEKDAAYTEYVDAQQVAARPPEYRSYTLKGEIPGTYREYTVHVPEAMQGWNAPHFGSTDKQRDLVFHFRTSIRADENGKPMFFIEEIQSDPIQAAVTNLEHAQWRLKNLDAIYARKELISRNHVLEGNHANELQARIGMATQDGDTALAARLNDALEAWVKSSVEGDVKAQAKAKALEQTKLQKSIDAEGFGKSIVRERNVPETTPFRDSWETQAVKRIIRIAAEEGHEKIGWTVGKSQSERYRLTQVADKIYWELTYNNGEPQISARGTKLTDKSQYRYEIVATETEAERQQRLTEDGFIAPQPRVDLNAVIDGLRTEPPRGWDQILGGPDPSVTVITTKPDGSQVRKGFDTREGAQRWINHETGKSEWEIKPWPVEERYEFGIETFKEASEHAELNYTAEPPDALQGKFRAFWIDSQDNQMVDGWFPTRAAAEARIAEEKAFLSGGFRVTEKGDTLGDSEMRFETRAEAEKFVADYNEKQRESETPAGSWQWDALEARRHIGSKATKLILDSAETSGVLQGEALEVGGKGMTAAYDERIPNIFRKLVRADKRYGEPEISKVRIPLDASDAERYSAERIVDFIDGTGPNPKDLKLEDGVDAWVAKLPKALREDALYEGFALYQRELIDHEQARILENINALVKQEGPINGAYSPVSHAITLTKGATAYTPIHETNHALYYMLLGLTESPEYKAGVKQLFDKVLEQIGGDPADKTLASHTSEAFRGSMEKFPYLFDQYVLSGAVPDPMLVPLFARLYEMLADPRLGSPESRYEGLNKQALGKFTPEMQGLFDSLLLSREAVRAAEAIARISYLNPELRKLMDPEEQKQYDAEVGDAFVATRDAIIRAVAESRRFFVVEERKRLQLGMAEAIKSDPQYRMLNFFKTGELWGDTEGQAAMLKGPDGKPLRFNARDVEYLMGAETLASLKAKKGLISEKGDAIPLDIAAEIFGFKGADAMLAALRDAQPTVKEAVRLRTEAILQSMYRGWLVDDHQALSGAAMDAVQTAKAGLKIARELRTLAAQLTGDQDARQRANMTPEAWDKLAERLAGTKLLGEMRPEAAAAAAARHVERAQEAIEKKDYRTAFNEMDGAMINHAMYKHLRRLHTEFGKAYEFLAEKAASDSARARLGLEDPTYRKLNDALLYSIELDDNAAHSAAKNPRIVQEFLDAVKANGQESQLSEQWDPAVIDGLLQGTKAWKTLTQEEAWQVLRAVKNIQHIAKTQNEIRRAGEIIAKDELISSAERHLQGMNATHGPLDPNMQPADTRLHPNEGGPAHIARLAMAKLDEPRLIMGMLGPRMKDAMIGGYRDSRALRDRLMKRVFDAVKEIWKDSNPADLLTELPGLEKMLPLQHVGLDGAYSKAWLMTVVRYLGSEESRAKMFKATEWNIGQVEEAIKKYLKPEDLDLIQKEHRLFDTELKPLEAEAYERRTGLDFTEAKAMSYEIAWDTALPAGAGVISGGSTVKYEGGYWPLRWDRRVGKLNFTLDQAAVTENLNGFPATPKGHLQPRTGYVDVPDFNWDGISTHILTVLHDVAFGDWVRDASKTLLDKRMKAAMTAGLGPEFYDEIKPWLWRVARDATGSVEESQRSLNHAGGWARSSLVYGAIGWNIGVAADFFHPIASGLMLEGAGFTLQHAVPSWLRTVKDGMAGLTGKPNPTREFVLANSETVKHREYTVHDDIRELVEKIVAPKGATARATEKIRDTAFWHIVQMDKMISTMIWDAKYRQAVDARLGHEQAVKLADERVEASMPTYSRMEMPSLHADRDSWMGSLIMFRGYWSKLYQMAHESGHEMIYRPMLEGASTSDRVFDASAWAGRMLGMLTIGAVFGDLMLGHGPRPEEDWGEWFLRRQLVAPSMLVPFASNLAEPLAYRIVHGRNKRAQPITSPAMAYYEQLIATVGKLTNSATPNDAKIAALTELGLMGLRLPARAPVRAGQYLYNRAQGRFPNAGPMQDLSGILYGQKTGAAARNQELTPFTAIGGRRGE